MAIKDNWVIPNAEMVTIRPPSPQDVYPAIVICTGHKYIDAIEIPNEYYIKVKIKGNWYTLHLPSEKHLIYHDKA